jgi:hypothetical protein
MFILLRSLIPKPPLFLGFVILVHLTKWYFLSAWAFGLNRKFGSVYSGFTNFGFQWSETVWFVLKLETDKLGFGFNLQFFGGNRTDRSRRWRSTPGSDAPWSAPAYAPLLVPLIRRRCEAHTPCSLPSRGSRPLLLLAPL